MTQASQTLLNTIIECTTQACVCPLSKCPSFCLRRSRMIKLKSCILATYIRDTACKKPVGGTFKSPRKQISTSRLHPVQCSSPSCSLSHITFCTFLIARPRLILELGIVYAHFDARMELRVWRNSTPAAKMGPVNNY